MNAALLLMEAKLLTEAPAELGSAFGRWLRPLVFLDGEAEILSKRPNVSLGPIINLLNAVEKRNGATYGRQRARGPTSHGRSR